MNWKKRSQVEFSFAPNQLAGILISEGGITMMRVQISNISVAEAQFYAVSMDEQAIKADKLMKLWCALVISAQIRRAVR